jgi:hypothetical protein
MSFLTTLLFLSLASQAVVAAPSPKKTLCPAGNSTVHKVHGASFNIECGIDHWGGDMTEGYGQAAASFHACIQRCTAQQGCLAVAYRAGDCYLKSTLTPATPNSVVDSAVLTNATSAAGSSTTATPIQAQAVGAAASTTQSTTTTVETLTITETGSPPSATASTAAAAAPTIADDAAAASPAAASPAAAAATYSAGSAGCARPAAKALAGKRGLCYNDPSLTTFFGSKVTWAYNWGQTPGSGLDGSLEYSPMLWSGESSVTGSWSANAKSAIAAGSSVLLGFNEPDLDTQSDMTVAEAVSAWQQFMQPLACSGARLAAPAVTNGGSPMGLAWLSSFLQECSGCTVDVVPIHWYGDATDPDDFTSHVQQAYSASGGRPIWITEFGATGSDDEIESFFQTVLPFLDSQSYVERYAYFMDGEGSLVNSAGTGLSDIGNSYNSI